MKAYYVSLAFLVLMGLFVVSYLVPREEGAVRYFHIGIAVFWFYFLAKQHQKNKNNKFQNIISYGKEQVIEQLRSGQVREIIIGSLEEIKVNAAGDTELASLISGSQSGNEAVIRKFDSVPGVYAPYVFVRLQDGQVQFFGVRAFVKRTVDRIESVAREHSVPTRNYSSQFIKNQSFFSSSFSMSRIVLYTAPIWFFILLYLIINLFIMFTS